MAIKWHGEEFDRYLKKTTSQRLQAAAYYLQNDIKESISEPSDHGQTPSAPGDPPHKDTGTLRRSISNEVDAERMVARVGTNLVYAKFLELGTYKMAARPFLRPAIVRCKEAIIRILSKPKGGA